MKRKSAVHFFLILLLLTAIQPLLYAQSTITQWTFEGDVSTPSTGSGTAAVVGGVTPSFNTGYTGTSTGGRAWHTTGYPAQGTGEATAGTQYNVSTTGYTSVEVSWHQRHSNTSANRVRLQYTINGSTWLDFEASGSNAENTNGGVNTGFDNGRYIADAGDAWFVRSADFSTVTGVSNNALFAVRFVSEFVDGSNYGASNSGSSYGGGTWRFDNVTFSGIAAGPALIADPATLSAFAYVVGNGPSQVQSYVLSGQNLSGTGVITISGTSHYEVSQNGSTFSSSLTLPYAAGVITGQPITVYVRMISGLPAGNYLGEVITNSGGGASTGVTCNGTVAPVEAPAITQETIPQFVQGINGTNTTRVPFAYRLTMTNLTPNATYRYFNSVVIEGDAPSSDGSGNVIFVKTDGVFIRSSSPGLGTPGQYGEFTTDGNGAFSGWFILEPSGNARFTPGNQVFMRVCLNDGAGGSTVTTRLTSATTATVINFGTAAASAEGTAIRCISSAGTRNFAFLYNNTSGSGRPLYGTSIENTGVDFAGTGSYAAFYGNIVQGVNGSWGGIVPNVNSQGIRLIEERSLSTGLPVNTTASANGMWGTTDTRNPSGGLDNVLVIDLTGGLTPVINAEPSSLSGFAYITGNGPSPSQSYTLSASNLTGSGNIAVTAPASYEISADNTTFSGSLSLPFASGILTGQPVPVYARLKAGLNAGNYNNQQISHSGGGASTVNVSCSGTVTDPVPVLNAETLPQFIQGLNETNTQRVPYAFRISLTNMLPNATYRYFNKVVLSSDSPTADGSGNCIFISNGGTYTRSSSPGLDSPGNYGEFTTNASGQYAGWFITEPTGNSRFTPGNEIYMRLMLNNGNGGTSVAYRLTSTSSATVINFGNQNQAGQGTGIRGISESVAGNLVYLYDNTAGTGRPVNGTPIETTGLDYGSFGSYAGFYTTDVQGNDGSWGSIVPNLLPDGIRRVEERSRETGEIVSVYTSENGVWGIYDTRNPFGGETDILVLDLMPEPEPQLMVNPSVLSGFNYPEGSGPSAIKTYLLEGTDLEGTGPVTVTAPEDYELSADGMTFTNQLEFAVSDGEIENQPVTISVRLKAGLPAGNYNNQIINNSGGGAPELPVSCSGFVTEGTEPVIADLTLPQYIQGINGTNTSRVPFAFRATIANLTPDATYRYLNKVVVTSDPESYDGAGNAIYVTPDGSFVRSSSPSLETPGDYGEFTTNADGMVSGWFITEPTGNERFTPGNQLFVRIALNDGNGGDQAVNLVTSADFATVLTFGTESLPEQGTAIHGLSLDNPGDFVYLFDNTAGEGRPLFATQIESSGIDFIATGVYAPFYCNDVAGLSGAWGGIVPNVNENGVQRIEVRSLFDGSPGGEYLSENGIWKWDTDTRNPTGGMEVPLLIDLIPWSVKHNPLPEMHLYADGNVVHVRITGNREYAVFSLYNAAGQLVLSKQTGPADDFRLGQPLGSGLYIARLQGEGFVVSGKIIIR